MRTPESSVAINNKNNERLKSQFEADLLRLVTREHQVQFDLEKHTRLMMPVTGHNKSGLTRTWNRDAVDYFLGKPKRAGTLNSRLIVPREEPSSRYEGDRFTTLDRSYPEIDLLIKLLTSSIAKKDHILAAPAMMWGGLPDATPVEQVQLLVVDQQLQNPRYYLLDEGINPYIYGLLSSFLAAKINSGNISLRHDEIDKFKAAEQSLRTEVEKLIAHLDRSYQETGRATIKLSDVLRVCDKASDYIPEYLIPPDFCQLVWHTQFP
ncbi:MAG: hypothetical protein HYV33_02630 [Candidatus Kerfeldbacteria bacterium]|nr:hypothetical protein [Candidatus Kerfeldbacteria bacterium]